MDRLAIERGRAVYNMRCYFCHGYDGNARTVAAGMLDPQPRDFTRAKGLDRGKIIATLNAGRPGTAMKPFSALLDPSEIEDVASFVFETFVRCDGRNTVYHTEANGWPDHAERYRAAFPFATGELPLDILEDALEPEARAGLALFRSACISCHEGRVAEPSVLGLAARGTAQTEAGLWSGHIEHQDAYDTPTIHDIAPVIADLAPSERRGATLYARACAQCHASDGSGQNWIGKFLHPNPPDFRTAEFAGGFDTKSFVRRTLEPPAGTSMPSFRAVLSEAEAGDIADYVRRAFIRPSPAR